MKKNLIVIGLIILLAGMGFGASRVIPTFTEAESSHSYARPPSLEELNEALRTAVAEPLRAEGIPVELSFTDLRTAPSMAGHIGVGTLVTGFDGVVTLGIEDKEATFSIRYGSPEKPWTGIQNGIHGDTVLVVQGNVTGGDLSQYRPITPQQWEAIMTTTASQENLLLAMTRQPISIQAEALHKTDAGDIDSLRLTIEVGENNTPGHMQALIEENKKIDSKDVVFQLRMIYSESPEGFGTALPTEHFRKLAQMDAETISNLKDFIRKCHKTIALVDTLNGYQNSQVPS